MSHRPLQISTAMLREMMLQIGDSLLSCGITLGAMTSYKAFGAQEAPRTYAITFTDPDGAMDGVIACCNKDALRLAARMTGKEGEALTDAIIDDAMGEWLNIMAGQLKSFAALDDTLGLPKRLDATGGHLRDALAKAQGLQLDIGEIDVVMWLGLAGAANVTIVQGD